MTLLLLIIAGTWFASCSSAEMTPDQNHSQQIAEDADVHMLGWLPDRRQQIAVANALLGRAPISGRLQVSIPPLYLIGDGLTIDLRSSE